MDAFEVFNEDDSTREFAKDEDALEVFNEDVSTGKSAEALEVFSVDNSTGGLVERILQSSMMIEVKL